MTKQEIQQKFLNLIEKRLGEEPTAKEIKDLAVAFKIINNIEQNDDFLKQLEKLPIQPMGDYEIYCKQPGNDSGFGLCD